MYFSLLQYFGGVCCHYDDFLLMSSFIRRRNEEPDEKYNPAYLKSEKSAMLNDLPG
jgi:hypothetical protein